MTIIFRYEKKHSSNERKESSRVYFKYHQQYTILLWLPTGRPRFRWRTTTATMHADARIGGNNNTALLQRRMGKRRRRGSNSSLDGGGRSRVFEFRQRTFTNVTSARMRKDVGQGAHTFHYPTLPLCHNNENPPLLKPPHSSFGGVNVLPGPTHPHCVCPCCTRYTYDFYIYRLL